MNLEKKILLFYLGLDNLERNQFKSYIGPRKFNDLFSEVEALSQDLNMIGPKVSARESKHQEKDLALMHIMRYLLRTSKSNADLAEAIENITNEKVSRPDKRGSYELKGKLLEYLLTAKDQDLMNIRNALVHMGKAKEPTASSSNLAKWFDIILAGTK